MSFLRHREIYPSDGDPGIVVDVPSHRLDEFPVSYFSASCTPALLASASPTGSDYAVKLPCWSTVFQQPANSVLTGCLSPGGKRSALLMELSEYRRRAIVQRTMGPLFVVMNTPIK